MIRPWWWLGMAFGLVVYGALYVVAFGQTRTETRIDTFDRFSNRTGYLILNNKTGRLDAYDTKSNHTGTSTITPPPTQVRPGQNVYITPQPSPGRRNK